MKKMTEQHLINAFGGESMAHMRYLHFALQAEREDFGNIARLFRATAHAEFIHAGDHFDELSHLNGGFTAQSTGVFGPSDTLKNLELAIAEETYEVEEMYPSYIEVAKLQGENGAQRSFEWALGTERMHKALFEKGRFAIETGRDVELGAINVCGVCGYTVEGGAPDRCPLCGVIRERFTSYASERQAQPA